MSAIVEICESNGATETITHNITNSNMGDTDAPNLDPITYPILPGDNSYAKYQRLHVTDMGGSSVIKNIRVWRTGSLTAGCSHKTNASTTNYIPLSYAQPVKTAIPGVDKDMPTSPPTSANLGINGSLTGQLTAPGYSDYLVHQIQTTTSATAGTTTQLNFRYDEIV